MKTDIEGPNCTYYFFSFRPNCPLRDNPLNEEASTQRVGERQMSSEQQVAGRLRWKHGRSSTQTNAPLLVVALYCMLLAWAGSMCSAAAQSGGKYDLGASETEIKIGQTAPYSGPLSSASEISKTEAAYIAMINENGGVNGRKVTFISLDDGYSPPKSVEQTRRLVEQEEVLAIFNQFGTPTSTAAQKYLNARKVPQVFCATGSSRFNDPSFPWSSSSLANYVAEAKLLGTYVASKLKSAKVAILFQNDDFGKDYVKGFKDAVAGNQSVRVVSEVSYEPTDPTIDSQISTLAASGADVFLNASAGRATAQSIRAVANLQWRPLHLLTSTFADIEGVFKPAGVEKAVGIISAQYMKSPSDPSWINDPGVIDYLAFMKKYRAGADPNSTKNVAGYLYGEVMTHILRKAGNDLTRENINNIALNLHDFKSALLLPSIKISTSPTQRHLISDPVLTRFDGEQFVAID